MAACDGTRTTAAAATTTASWVVVGVQDIHRRNQQYTLKFSSSKLFTIKDGQNIINDKIASNHDWFSLKSLIPENLQSDILNKSFYSSTFNASLHMAKKDKDKIKKIDIRQSKPFSDIYLKKHE